MRLTRRAWLAAGLGALGARAAWARQQQRPLPRTTPPAGSRSRPPVLRIGVLQPHEAIGSGWSEALGVQLGAEEAARAAALLGVSIEWSSREPGSPAQAAEQAAALASEFHAHAILAALAPEPAAAAAEGAARAGVVFLPLAGQQGVQPAADPGLRFLVGLGPDASARAIVLALAKAGVSAAAVKVPPAPPPPGASVSAAAWATEWHGTLERYGAEQLNQRFALRFARAMDGRAWCGWAAVKVLAEAALRARPASAEALAAALRRTAFDGHKGASLSFRASDQRLLQPAYVVGRLPADGAGEPKLLAELDAEEIYG